ncbi:MAG TPA: hypothetical protein VGM84_07465 [Steroidobacteraceae bacterium]|jgi:hypothetical protein
MPNATRGFLVVGVVCLSVLGCASKAPVTANSDHTAIAPAVMAATPANAASAAAAPPSKTNAQPTSASKQPTVKIIAHPPGSRRVVRDGVVYYCSSDPVLGTKISGPETCMTEEEAAEHERQAQEIMRQLTRPTLATPSSTPGPLHH